ncbi:MAG: type IV pilus assembly protein PilM [Parcubacteria group bacterium]|nr:type IV pilus assembly protein PilM [Parcubacteria group bacterium]MCR4342762.1 type IV pilus assembly protein PilM [Patescibacteria group bacterium]
MAFSLSNSLSSILGQFVGKDQGVLGLDLGSASFKVVQIKKDKERAILQTYGELSVGPYADKKVGQSVVLSEEKMIEAVGDLLKESNVKTKRAAVAIPLKASFVTTITLPVVSDSKIEEVVKLEARRYIPVPISETVFDWKLLPDNNEEADDTSDSNIKKNQTMSVLLVAIHKDTVDQYKRMIAKLGIELESFEIEIFSAVHSSLGREISPILVVDFGASTTKIAIVDHGIVRMVHTINKGSQDLTLAISHSLNIEFDRAEDMKKEIGLSSKPEHKEFVDVMKPILQYIFSEANRAILDYQKKYKRVVSRIVLSGGGALLDGLTDEVVNNFGIETSNANPFAKTEFPAFLESALTKTGPSFGVSVGLALRGFEE